MVRIKIKKGTEKKGGKNKEMFKNEVQHKKT